MGQLVFFCDMIILIKHKIYWELIRQKKQVQFNKDNIRENKHIVDHGYEVGDNIMLNNHTVYKYETPYKVPFIMKQSFTNVTENVQYGGIKIKYNIRCIKTYKYDTKFEDSSSNIYMTMSTYDLPVIYFCLKTNIETKYMIGCAQGY